MCGIFGIYSRTNKPIKNIKKKLILMEKSISYRGPDQKGFFISRNKTFGFGSNRLAITAPQEKLKIPLTKDNSKYLIFNGEIYNYKDLQLKLKTSFIGNSDTEVLYEYLNKFGAHNLNELNGMWAFAYYDSKKNELTLSRDLIGEKQIFYYISNKEVIFASEIKPILNLIKNKKINFNSFLTAWKYNSCRPGDTLINGVKRLKPGVNLIISNNKLTIKKNIRLNLFKWQNFFKTNKSKYALFKKFEEIFSHEVNLRIPDETKFSLLLSGGLDSNLLAHFIRKKTKSFNTIFAISDNKEIIKSKNKISEIDIYKKTCKNLHLKKNIIDLPRDRSLLKHLKYFSANSYDGCIDPNTTNFSLIANKLKSENIKVAFVSDGPDELLVGYDVDIEANKIDKYYKNKKSIPRNIVKKLNLKRNTELEFSYKPFYHRVNHSVCPNKFLKTAIKDFNFNSIKSFGNLNQNKKKLNYNQMRSLNYIKKSLPDMFNLRSDKAFMFNSVENRNPYLSKSIIEFFFSMHEKFKVNKSFGKIFFREYISHKFPKKVSKYLAYKQKKGMGGYLLSNSIIKKLKLEETIKKTNILSKYPFVKNIKSILLDKKTHIGNKWAVFCLIQMHNNLNNQ